MTRKTQHQRARTDLVAFMQTHVLAEIELHPSQVALIEAIEQGKTVEHHRYGMIFRMHTVNGKVFGLPHKPKLHGSHSLTIMVDEAAGLDL